jgi:dihydroneopterin aldolase
MDRIIMENLYFYGFHGVLEAEKELGQKFIVSIEIFLDLKEAGLNDDVKKSIDYYSVYLDVKDIVENRRFNLIEAVAEKIADFIIEKYPLTLEVKVKVLKPEAPVRGIFDNFGVEIWRKR